VNSGPTVAPFGRLRSQPCPGANATRSTPLALHLTHAAFEPAAYGPTGWTNPPRPFLMRNASNLEVFRDRPSKGITPLTTTPALAVPQRQATNIQDPVALGPKAPLCSTLPS